MLSTIKQWYYRSYQRQPQPMKRLLPCLETLEGRDVPAVVATLVPSTGALEIRFDNNSIYNPRDPMSGQQVSVRSNINGELVINNVVMQRNGNAIAASSVNSIRAYGSDLDNLIDLQNVTSARFRGLDNRIEVYGGNGNDRLWGSAFADKLFGQNGDDDVKGLSGNDRLEGGRGNDLLDGGWGNDVLVGGSGRDNFLGGRDDDIALDYVRSQDKTIFPSNSVEKY